MRLIDADAFMDEVTQQTEFIKAWDISELTQVAEVLYEGVKAQIEKMPTIEAEPVRYGKWIKDRLVSTSGGTYGVRRCSLCEAYYEDIGYGWNYCPNCGAKMDEVEE